jgi:major intracellular serine protease
MKVIATKNLNVRVGVPSVNAPCYNYLVPGTVIDVEGICVDGDTFDGNNKWYKGLDGNYYWSGGVLRENLADLKGITSNWGISLLEIDKIWNETTGENVRIAVLDTGIVKDHPDFDFRKIEGQNFITRNDPIDDLDGHGTHNAGTISAKGLSKVRGIAPDATLLIYKVMDREYSIHEPPVIDAIAKAIEDKANIISMSFALGFGSINLHNQIQTAHNKGIILIASSGNEGLNTDRFPSCYEECQCIGAINRSENLTDYSSSPKSKILDLLAPGDDIYSTYLDPKWKSLNGTSMSAAFVSGVAALLFAWKLKYKPNLNSSDVIDALKISADDYGIILNNKPLGYGIINPNKALQLLKKI